MVCIISILFIHSSVGEVWVKNAATNLRVQVSVQSLCSFLLGTYPAVELLDLMIILCLTF